MKKITKDAAAKKPSPEHAPDITDEELQAFIDDDAAYTETKEAEAVASTPVSFARLGLDEIAYVRRTELDGEEVWSIFSAMGHPLGAAPTLAEAWSAIAQNDMRPVHVN